jgi:hypothetical protein
MVDFEKCKKLLSKFGLTESEVEEFVKEMYLVVGEILDRNFENKNVKEN